MRVLLVTPDERFLRLLQRESPDDLRFLAAADAAAAIRLLDGTPVDAAVLDAGLDAPARDEFLHWWRALPQRIALPLLIAGGAPGLPAHGLPGARAVDRDPTAISRALAGAAPLTLDRQACLLRRDDTELRLTPSEAALLHVLIQHDGPLATADLAREALGYRDAAGAPVVRTHLSNLRKKCARAGLPDPIRARRGLGYRAAGVRLIGSARTRPPPLAPSESPHPPSAPPPT